MTTIIDRPWYRHFWVWFMLAPLIATVLASIVTLLLAGSPPELVVADPGQPEPDRQATEMRAAPGP
jgi:hypothetical protein